MFRIHVVRFYAAVLLCWTMCWAIWAQAQQTPVVEQSASTPSTDSVPHFIKFSGKLKDGSGKPKSGVVGVTFALYKDQEGGAALWLETQNVQADAAGHYAVSLGATQASGLPTDVFASGEARWLGVQPEGQAEQARVFLPSVPYALKAGDAATIGGLPPSAFMRVTPESNGATTTQTGAEAGSTIHTPSILKTVKTNGGTANFFPLWTNATTIGNSALFQSSTGQIGVNTNSPAASLQVNAPNQLGLFVEAPFSGVGSGIDLVTTGSKGRQWEILATGSSAAQGPGRLNIRDVSDGRDVLNIDSNDNVNINAVLNLNGFLSASTSLATGAVNATTGSNARFAAGVNAFASAGSGATLGVNGGSVSPGGIGVLGDTGESTIFSNFFGSVAAGVWGDTSFTGGGAMGVIGTADNAIGVAAHNNSSASAALYVQNDSNNSSAVLFDAFGDSVGGECFIDVGGDLHCTGTVGAAVAVQGGTRRVALYSMQAAQNWFEDFGSGHLSSGLGVVKIDSTFTQTVNLDSGYHVFLTPVGECSGLYVTNKTANSFEVHEIGGGQSNVAFDYRVVALRRGFENIRLTDMTEQLKKPDAQPRMSGSGKRITLPRYPAPTLQVAPAKVTAQR